jgi:outer membrane protein
MVGAHLLPGGVLDPWIGVGTGYEILSVTRSAAWSRLDLQASGLELLDLELGLDLRLTAGLRVGPVLSTSIGRYTSVVLNGRTTHDFDTVVHGWGMVGIRGAYDL